MQVVTGTFLNCPATVQDCPRFDGKNDGEKEFAKACVIDCILPTIVPVVAKELGLHGARF
jgi:hypothetical protein